MALLLLLLVAQASLGDARLLPFLSAASSLTLGAYAPPGPSDARGPCPAFNIMANHGVFPRDGSAISRKLIVHAFSQFYGVRKVLVEALVLGAYASGVGNRSSDTIDLVQLRAHGKIEHDVSLVRDDAAEGNNYLVNSTLFDQLVAHSSDGQSITVEDMGRFRRDRYAFSKATNPQLTFGVKEESLAFAEAAVLLAVNGKLPGAATPIARLRQFLLEQRYPDDLKPKMPKIGTPVVAVVMARMKAAAGKNS